MEYADQVFSYLLQLQPGQKVDVNSSKDPERFINQVKNLIDNWNLKGIEFNEDYTVLRRINNFQSITRDLTLKPCKDTQIN
jgi:uncharacterized protein (DUF2249 family)